MSVGGTGQPADTRAQVAEGVEMNVWVRIDGADGREGAVCFQPLRLSNVHTGESLAALDSVAAELAELREQFDKVEEMGVRARRELAATREALQALVEVAELTAHPRWFGVPLDNAKAALAGSVVDKETDEST